MTRKKLSFSAQSFIGMGAGIVIGLLAGEEAAVLQPFGAVFLQILQMTVIPFLVVSLLLGISAMDPAVLRKVGAAMAFSFVALWALGLASVFTLGQVFPSDGTPSFHVHPQSGGGPSESSMLDLFISRNPFASLADGAVPAVVLFFILLSVNLVRHPNKKAVLDFLQPIQDALLWLTRWLTKIVPYGVFILTAELAGTISIGDFSKLSLYLAFYLLGSLILTFWLLPMTISLSTSYGYRRLMRECMGAVVLAISSGSAFVALPILIQSLRALIADSGGEQRTTDIEAVIPVAFNFPHAGSLFIFLFVLFATAAYGIDTSPWTDLTMVASGIPLLFGSSLYAVGFLLDQVGVPNDALALFVNAGSIVGRFNAGVSVVSLIAISLWTHAALTRQLRVRPLQLTLVIGGTLAAFLAIALVIRPLVSHGDTGVDHYRAQSLTTQNVIVLDTLPSAPLVGAARERLMRGEPIVVGYLPDALPYSYRNAAGELVGYYVAMADRLGADLGVEIHLVAVPRDQQDTLLISGRLDTVLAPVPVTPSLLRHFDVSRIYAEERAFVLLKAGHSEDVEGRIKAGDASGLRLAVIPGYLPVERYAELVPGAELIVVESVDAFRKQTFDGLLLDEVLATAEAIKNPLYHAVPISDEPIMQFALPVRSGSDLRIVLDTWLQMVEQNGFLDEIDQQWIEGQFESEAAPRRPLLLHLLPGQDDSAVKVSVPIAVSDPARTAHE
jgi:Na+/H+-dicarboxylate symporter/ABC-type amino acid transport substrate-binding protein